MDNMIRLEWLFREWKQLWDTFTCIGQLFREGQQLLRHINLCRTANMSWWTCVVVKQTQSSQPLGKMVSSGTYIGLGSEADCRFSCLSISETAEFGFESGTLMNSTEKESQLVVSWLLHASDWRLKRCHLLLPRTSSEHSLWMIWRSVFVGGPLTP